MDCFLRKPPKPHLTKPVGQQFLTTPSLCPFFQRHLCLSVRACVALFLAEFLLPPLDIAPFVFSCIIVVFFFFFLLFLFLFFRALLWFSLLGCAMMITSPTVKFDETKSGSTTWSYVPTIISVSGPSYFSFELIVVLCAVFAFFFVFISLLGCQGQGMFSVSYVFSSLLLPHSCFSSVESFLRCSKCRRWLLYTLPIEWATQWVKQCYDAWSQARLFCISFFSLLSVDLFSLWDRLLQLRKREARSWTA